MQFTSLHAYRDRDVEPKILNLWVNYKAQNYKDVPGSG